MKPKLTRYLVQYTDYNDGSFEREVLADSLTDLYYAVAAIEQSDDDIEVDRIIAMDEAYHQQYICNELKEALKVLEPPINMDKCKTEKALSWTQVTYYNGSYVLVRGYHCDDIPPHYQLIIQNEDIDGIISSHASSLETMYQRVDWYLQTIKERGYEHLLQ